MNRINLAEKFQLFSEIWTPKIIGGIDDYDIKIAKIEGSFEWHSHADADEFFFVVSGKLRMKYRDREELLGPGDIIVVPRGVEHLPVAEPTAEIMMIEARGTVNTGDARGARTVSDLERL